MFRRCIWELSVRQPARRIRQPVEAQMPFFLSSRNKFSTTSQKKSPQTSASAEQTENSKGSISKLIVGGVVVGAAAIAAYQTGYINPQVKNGKPSLNSRKVDAVEQSENLDHASDQVVFPNNGKPNISESGAETTDKTGETTHKDVELNSDVFSEIAPANEEPAPVTGNGSANLSEETASETDEQAVHTKLSSDDSQKLDNSMASRGINVEENMANETSEKNDRIDIPIKVSEEIGAREAAPHHDPSIEMPKDSVRSETEAEKSLAQSYSLQDEESLEFSRKGQGVDDSVPFSDNKEVPVATSEKANDMENSEDGKVLIDLIEAIHAAEMKQAELDARIFAEEKRLLKEKYEKELKDTRARELMYAEEASILEKELNREKHKAAATIKLLQEKAKQRLQEELRRKDEETEIQLKKVQELGKAELMAAIAKEKATQIEKISEADLHINALCMAFYARSEEARQTHSVHKLTLGTLALEDALSKGLPILAEVDALRKSLEGIDKDSLLDLALSSLPEETLKMGTDTQMQLNQKFDSLKGSLRHFSLIPAGGGGILAHTVAHIASSIKMKEDYSGEGIESIISKVEYFLAEGKLAEAAETLEGGVCGSEAEGIIAEWVKQARNRTVVEQVLSLLQSYATSVAFT